MKIPLLDAWLDSTNEEVSLSESLPEKNNDNEHDWELVAQTYAPPVRLDPAMNAPAEILEKALFGFTTFLWQCNNTREIKTQVLIGRIVTEDEPQNQAFDQALIYGPQSFKYKGRTMIVGVAPDEERVPVK